MEEKIVRYNPSIEKGLSNEQVEKRKKENLVNYDTNITTKSIKQILYENFFTLFNILNLALAIAVFCVGSYKNMLFFIIVIVNTAISTIQEIHSKKVIDKLSIIAQTKARAIRNGKKQEIPTNEIVLDDIIEYHMGNQVVVDSIVQNGEILVNESYITGEPNSITKKPGDMILSGSFIVGGKCIAKVEHIADDNYTSKISSGAKYIKQAKSEIMLSLKKIIKFATYAIIPIGTALFLSQYYLQNIPLKDSVVQTVAAVIGMIPEGLVLLTSTVLAVSVIRLSKSKVLVQDLYCIETLARVDTLCLDKTGTLTKGYLQVEDYIPLSPYSEKTYSKDDLANILSNFAQNSEDENSTIQAIKSKFTDIKEEFALSKKVAFSSEKKWSGISFKDKGSFVIGAPNFVFESFPENIQKQIDNYITDYRVLVLAHSKYDFNEKNLPESLEPIGLILMLDTIRENAFETINFFKQQGVDIKLISGDNPVTVAQIAKRVGVENYNNLIDMSAISDTQDLTEIATKYSIFGRVSPNQKKELVKALQKAGKTVAMTGDGVNDVLALKSADCSIATANSNDAAKSVAQIVLLTPEFSAMPKIVAEGRRTINNIQRSASLFLVKTIYSTLLALMVLFMKDAYPFVPIQLSLISVVTIGIPSFMLALEPNKERIHGEFLKNIVYKALPTGLAVVLLIFILTLCNRYHIIPDNKLSSLCVLTTGICELSLLFSFVKKRKSEESILPFSIYRLVLAISMTGLFILGLTYFAPFFNIVL